MKLESPDVVQHLFFAMAVSLIASSTVPQLISVFTCIIRSDYNFAFGLLGFYMMRTSASKGEEGKTAKPVSSCSLFFASFCSSQLL